ncbi:hypothetical protein NDU88_000831 [Pleurodeles waltl]|uniref:Uncharacterized protein n=1 Tax=Pleurodeles waltl TaxID=8319 RepID=A0AAV7TGV1_PLEWA|nr:hypothetical protein NDU88_000831 [Pleurodeles waltl]
MQLGWTLQTLKAGRVPWQHIRAREIFGSFNVTRQQQLMAKKEATCVMLNIEKLEKLPVTGVPPNAAPKHLSGEEHNGPGAREKTSLP